MFPTKERLSQLLRPSIDTMEQERLAYMKVFRLGMTNMASAVLLTVIILFTPYGQVALITVIIAIILIIVTAVKLYRKRKRYRERFKASIIAGVVRHLVEQCSLPNETAAYRYEHNYQHDCRVSDYHIESCSLFNDRIDEISGEDLISGVLGLTDFEFSELKLVRIDKSTNSKGHTSRTYVTLFDGVFFVADFHKHFQGITLLKAGGSHGIGGWFNRMGGRMGNMFRSKPERSTPIKLENDAFNRIFFTSTTNETEARYILSPVLMDNILKFREKHPEQVEFAFAGSRLYIAVSSSRNYFEPDMGRPVADQIGGIREELVFFFDMIELFDLNTRIWSKS